MSYKEIPMKEALNRYADGERVFYRYFTNGGYSWIGGIRLDHLRRNPERYEFFVVEPNKTLFEKQLLEGDFVDTKAEMGVLYAVDVKEALKEYLAWINEDKQKDNAYVWKAEEIFGKELMSDES